MKNKYPSQLFFLGCSSTPNTITPLSSTRNTALKSQAAVAVPSSRSKEEQKKLISHCRSGKVAPSVLFLYLTKKIK